MPMAETTSDELQARSLQGKGIVAATDVIAVPNNNYLHFVLKNNMESGYVVVSGFRASATTRCWLRKRLDPSVAGMTEVPVLCTALGDGISCPTGIKAYKRVVNAALSGDMAGQFIIAKDVMSVHGPLIWFILAPGHSFGVEIKPDSGGSTDVGVTIVAWHTT